MLLEGPDQTSPPWVSTNTSGSFVWYTHCVTYLVLKKLNTYDLELFTLFHISYTCMYLSLILQVITYVCL